MRLVSIGRANRRVAVWREQASDPSIAFLKSFSAWILCVALVGALLGACAAQLAPNFDRTIIDGLSKTNEDAMTLFSRVSAGTQKQTFASRSAAYDSLIGKVEALKLQASIRPEPQPNPALSGFLARATTADGRQTVGIPSAPTPNILARMAKAFTLMRDTDRAQGLRPAVAGTFRSEFEILIEQALTYERALER